MTVRDIDRGYAALIKRVHAAGARISVGILEAEGAEQKKEADAAESKHAVTLIEVAVWNEFGTATIPERSFIRAWFDEKRESLHADMAKLLQSVVAGKRTKEQALNLMGQMCVGQIQARIAAGISPDLAESTIEAKGSTVPLINTGQLRSGVSYRVEDVGR